MKIKQIASIAFLSATLLVSATAHAQTVKRGLIGCVSEDLLDELLTYINKSDQSGMMHLLVSGKCMLLKVGDPVSVISAGFMTSIIRYKGIKLHVPSEVIR